MVAPPISTPKWSFLVGKPIVVGYQHFRKLPDRHWQIRVFFGNNRRLDITQRLTSQHIWFRQIYTSIFRHTPQQWAKKRKNMGQHMIKQLHQRQSKQFTTIVLVLRWSSLGHSDSESTNLAASPGSPLEFWGFRRCPSHCHWIGHC